MSTKGKEKEVDSTVILDDDDDTNFFVKKKKKRAMTRYSPVRSPSPVHILSDSDDEDGRARAKKPKPKPKKPVSIVPVWARTHSSHSDDRKKSRSVGRGSTEERRGRDHPSETIVIESSPEKDAMGDRREVELTPPPEMSETKKAEIAQAIMSAVALKPSAGNATKPTESRNESELPSSSAVNDTVRAVFRMVAPPERKEEASAKAIEHYEKKRTITMGRGQPLEYAVASLATQIRKPPDEIIVTYNGDRIYSTLLTPQVLGIEYDAEFVCYEKESYHRMETEARELRRQADTHEEQEEEEEEDLDDTGNASQSSEAPIEISDKVKINLLGPFGTVSAIVQPHVTAGSLCKYYLKKTNRDKDLVNTIRLSLDGETFEPDTIFEDMDVDAGDQVDVVQI